MNKIKEIYYHPISKIVMFLIFLWIGSSIGILYLENGELSEIKNSFWWAIVTITTVGYGDYSPETLSGRALAIILMLSGIGLASTVTGSISSIFTTRKIMEGKGLGMIESLNHIVVCGWNENIEHLLACMSQITSKTNKDIVLINDLSEDQLNSILAKFPNLNIKFTRGDYSNETTLNMANIKLISICDGNHKVLLKHEKEYGVKGYLDLKEMLESELYVNHMNRNRRCWCTHECSVGLSIPYHPHLVEDLLYGAGGGREVAEPSEIV